MILNGSKASLHLTNGRALKMYSQVVYTVKSFDSQKQVSKPPQTILPMSLLCTFQLCSFNFPHDSEICDSRFSFLPQTKVLSSLKQIHTIFQTPSRDVYTVIVPYLGRMGGERQPGIDCLRMRDHSQKKKSEFVYVQYISVSSKDTAVCQSNYVQLHELTIKEPISLMKQAQMLHPLRRTRFGQYQASSAVLG